VEGEDEPDTRRELSPKRVKSEDPFMWVKHENEAEIIIILDDDEEVSPSLLLFRLKSNSSAGDRYHGQGGGCRQGHGHVHRHWY